MRKLTSCVGYAKRMAARMQFNAVKDQLNMVLVALAGEPRAKVNVPNCPGSRCNVSNQSVQTEANIITEKEYTALMRAVVEKAEQCQEKAQSLIRRQDAVIVQLHSEVRLLRLQSEVQELQSSATTCQTDVPDLLLRPGVASSSTPQSLEGAIQSHRYQSTTTLVEQYRTDRLAQNWQKREERHRLRAQSHQELHIHGGDEDKVKA